MISKKTSANSASYFANSYVFNFLMEVFDLYACLQAGRFKFPIVWSTKFFVVNYIIDERPEYYYPR